MLYKIEFEVDSRVDYRRDVALVSADSAEEAKAELRKYINFLDSESSLYKIFNIELFTGKVFTGRHGCN